MNWSRASIGVAAVVAMLLAGCADDDPGVDVTPVDESTEVDEEPDEPAERSEAPEESPQVDEEPDEPAEESEAPEESPEADEPDKSSDDSDEAEDSVRRWTEDDFEYKLAVAGEGKRLDLDDPVIDTYAAALDAAAEHCPEERSMVGDIAVRSIEILDEEMPAHNETVLVMLQAIADSATAAEGTQDCSSIAATLVVLIMEG